ncbi:MAG: hypothetical protein WDM76_11810 [Limisphaerales bacterium]
MREETREDMKNPTARINLEKVDQAFTRSVRMARYARWGIKPRNKLLGNAPTAMELATLVASLARTPSDNYEKLCGSALNLWFTSVEAISLQQNCNADYQIADAQIEAERLRLRRSQAQCHETNLFGRCFQR